MSYPDYPLTEQQACLLDAYLTLMVKWNHVFNLTAITDKQAMIENHVLDSLAITPYIDKTYYIDVGSGPGLPGIPLAIFFPEKHFVLLDSNGKKTRFLQQVKALLGMGNIEIIHDRVEHYLPDHRFDGVLSRAFSDLKTMLSLTKHLCHTQGVFLAMKGQYPDQELKKINQPFKIYPLSNSLQQKKRHLVMIENRIGE